MIHDVHDLYLVSLRRTLEAVRVVPPIPDGEVVDDGMRDVLADAQAAARVQAARLEAAYVAAGGAWAEGAVPDAVVGASAAALSPPVHANIDARTQAVAAAGVVYASVLGGRFAVLGAWAGALGFADHADGLLDSAAEARDLASTFARWLADATGPA
ncbi:MAG: hypothetical protein R3181_00310 [Rubricoccaceae bacterium]|nr:hypothetical protein [Rubricoccaceae bacterium]